MKNLEHQEQVKVVNYLNILKKQKKIITFFAIPNGGSRHKLEAINLKREGVVSGVPDLCILLKDYTLYIEMKRPKKILKSGKKSSENLASEEQLAFIESLESTSYAYGVVAYGFEEAYKYVEEFTRYERN